MRRSTIVTFSFAVVSLLGACSKDACFEPGLPGPFTMDQVYHQEITRLAGKKIVIDAELHWRLYEPGERQGGNDSDTLLVASPLTLLFENADLYMPGRFRGQERGNIRIVSPAIHKEFKPPGVETYYFGEHELHRDTTYRLVGSFEYRDSVSPPPLDSPEFLEQSNNPVYWSQTFDFVPLRAIPFPGGIAER